MGANSVCPGQSQLCQCVLAIQTCYSATPVLGLSLVGKENYANETDSFLIWKNVRRGQDKISKTISIADQTQISTQVTKGKMSLHQVT